MSICSYIVYPVKGRETQLKNTIDSWNCITELYPSTDQSIFILVTDTPNESAEKEIKDNLAQCDDIECFTLSSANNEL